MSGWTYSEDDDGTIFIASVPEGGGTPDAGSVTGTSFSAATLVTAADTIAANATDATVPTSAAVKALADTKAPLASPAFTGTPTGITKAHVGLGSVDNTADVSKPVSMAQQTALNGKASRRNARTALTEGVIKGGNVTVKPSGNSWGGLWAEWDWANWIKPQVDRAVALGLNTIRIIGAPEAVVNPANLPAQISQATYNARWQQLADYCLGLGLRLYPCLTAEWAFHGYTGAPENFHDATVTAAITSTAAVLAAYQNVIGFDLFQEGSGSADGLLLSDILALYAAIRAVAPGVPLTTSSSSGNFGTAAGLWTDAASLPYQAWVADGGADFIDIHIYLEGVNAASIDSLIERTGLPVLIGEYGADQSLSAGSQLARYVSGLVLHNRPGILGSLVWALADQGTTAANQFGVWDNTGFSQPSFPSSVGSTPLSVVSGKRTALVNQLRRFAAAPVPVQAQQAQPNMVPATTSRPVNSSTGWQAGANSNLFTDPKGVGVGASAAGNISINTHTSAKIPVLPSTPYRAEVEVLTSAAGRAVSLSVSWFDSSGTFLTTSTAVPGTSGVNAVTPARLTGVFTSHPSAASGVLIVSLTGATAANESLVVLAAPRPRFAAL